MRDIIVAIKKYGWAEPFRLVKHNWKKPDWWKWALFSMISPLIYKNNTGSYILEEEWDNLIILDACRFDLFEREIGNWNIKGKLEYRISRGANTGYFLRENFERNEFKPILKEIVYVTANPLVNRYLGDKLYKVISVWKFGWNEELGTVPPEIVYEAALHAIRKNSGKRFIIHFIQPHEPHIISDSKAIHAFDLLKEGKISRDEAFRSYRQNLRIVMPYVEKLCKIVPGRTVITSDHGEGAGERVHPLIPLYIYGHFCPGNPRIECLTKVPWFICEEEGSLDKVEREIIKLQLRKLRKLKI